MASSFAAPGICGLEGAVESLSRQYRSWDVDPRHTQILCIIFYFDPTSNRLQCVRLGGSRIGFPTLMTQEDKAVIYLHSFLLHSATSSSSSPLNSFCLGTFGFYWLALFILSLLRFGSPRQPFLLSAALFPRHSLKSHSSQISLFPGSYFLPLFILFSFSRLSHLRSLLPPPPPPVSRT